MSKLSVTHPTVPPPPVSLVPSSSASHNIFTELQRTNYFQWWSCHVGDLGWKNILPPEEHTPNWHVFLLFRREKKWERHTCSFFVLWYFYKFKTVSLSCHNSLKSKLTWMWHYENTILTKSNLREWPYVHSLSSTHLTEELNSGASWKEFEINLGSLSLCENVLIALNKTWCTTLPTYNTWCWSAAT